MAGRAWAVTRIPTSRAAIRPRRPANAFHRDSIPDTGYWHAFGNMFNSSAPDKGVGVNINIPLRNRQNQADQVRSVIEYRQAQMAALQAGQHHYPAGPQCPVCAAAELCGAPGRRCRARLCFTEPRRGTEEVLAGSFHVDAVLQASSALTQAESNVLAAATNYEKSKVQLDLYTATTLASWALTWVKRSRARCRRCRKYQASFPRTLRIPGLWSRNTHQTTPTPPTQNPPSQ